MSTEARLKRLEKLMPKDWIPPARGDKIDVFIRSQMKAGEPGPHGGTLAKAALAAMMAVASATKSRELTEKAGMLAMRDTARDLMRGVEPGPIDYGRCGDLDYRPTPEQRANLEALLRRVGYVGEFPETPPPLDYRHIASCLPVS